MKIIIRSSIFFGLFVVISLVFSSCKGYEPKAMDLAKENLIPAPVSLLATGSSFRITNKTRIILNRDNEAMQNMADIFKSMIHPTFSLDPKVIVGEKKTKRNIHFLLGDFDELGDEGYLLKIDEEKLVLEANTENGIFYGIQTLKQLLPTGSEKDSLQNAPLEIASGEISDYPNFSYRGAMLDISRHFFGPEQVKEVIDWLAMYKMNYLHLHLSDDQGWRIEIKKWPKLTEIGGSTEVGGGKGGYFTQEDFKELVEYANERFVTIVPEIDMPGHTNAALASYSFLNCDNKVRELYTGTDVGFSTFCTSKDSVYLFLDDVIAEICSISPGPYFHIGGDESHVTAKKDYIAFVNRVQEIVARHGKKMIGWDEIVQGEMDSNSIAQVWRSPENALTGSAKGMSLILSPAERCYLDMKYDSTTKLGLNWAGYIEVDHAYNWYPKEYIQDLDQNKILGIECPLWTETVTNMDEMEYLVFPRLIAYAEIGWSPREKRIWDDFQLRLGAQAARMEDEGLNYYRSPLIDWDL